MDRCPECLGKYRNKSLRPRLHTQPAAGSLNILSGILVAPLKWLAQARAETTELEKLLRDSACAGSIPWRKDRPQEKYKAPRPSLYFFIISSSHFVFIRLGFLLSFTVINHFSIVLSSDKLLVAVFDIYYTQSIGLYPHQNSESIVPY